MRAHSLTTDVSKGWRGGQRLRQARNKSKPGRQRRLLVEPLEDRRVLAFSLPGLGEFAADDSGTVASPVDDMYLRADLDDGPAGESNPFDVTGSDLLVSTFEDVIDPDDGLLSLREAVIHANTNVGDFRILLQPGTYSLTIKDANEDEAQKGDLDITGNGAVTIVAVGAGQTTVNAADLGDRVFQVLAGADLTLDGLTITGGTTASTGPDIGRHGGGVLNQGILTIINSTFTGNSASRDGAGIYNASGTLTIRNSTISGNISSRHGGGIYNTGGTLTVTNSTIYGNTASNSSGGISVDSGSEMLHNTIVAGNLQGSSTPSDINGTVAAASSYNLIGTGGSGDLVQGTNGNLVGIDPALVLEPLLQDNGGTSLTHALIAGSPAIDAGDPSFDPDVFTPPLTTDQRGQSRIVDGNLDGTAQVDIGAYEYQPPTLLASLDNGTLSILDVHPTDMPNQMTVLLSGTDLVITDANERFASAPSGGTLSDQGRTLTTPLASVASLVIDLAGGDDQLTVDFASGNPIPAGGLVFDGGAGNDALDLVGGTLHTSKFTYVDASGGSVVLDPDGTGSALRTITYAGVTPIVSTIASDVVELVYTGGDETITVTDIGGGHTTVSSTLGATTTFANPAELLQIVATGGTDLIRIDSLADGYASLMIQGDDVSDVVNFNGPLTFAAGHGLTVSDVGTVNLPNATSDIASSGAGAVSIAALRNIAMASGSSITTADGDITLSANQQATPATGSAFSGVRLNAATVSTAGAGNILIKGRGGNSGLNNYGVFLQSAAKVIGGPHGTVTVQGTGGASPGNSNFGVRISDTDTRLAAGGAVLVEGTGGGSGGSGLNYGVIVSDGGAITSVGSIAPVTVRGFGGNPDGTGGFNRGVYISNSQVSSMGGAVLVEGIGGGTAAHQNIGVAVDGGGIITSSGTGADATVTVRGVGGSASGTDGNQNYGVWITGSGTRTTSGGGAVLVEGIGGGSGDGMENHGVRVSNGALITSAGTDLGATVTVRGDGGALQGNGSDNHGVFALDSGSKISSSGGNVEVIGTGGGGTSSFGIRLATGGQVDGTTGSPQLRLTADSMDLLSSPSVQVGGNAVVLRPLTAGTPIDLGGADVLTGTPLTLGLTDMELDRVIAGTLTIGDADSGPILLTESITRSTATDVHLVSGQAIVFDSGSIHTAGGDLHLEPATEIRPIAGGVNITAGQVLFASGSILQIDIQGTTVDDQYWQLNIAGNIDLTGVSLNLTGSPTLMGGEAFTIVNNGGSEPIVGEFDGLPEGAVISNFLGSELEANITYQGGDGNDVVLTVEGGPSAIQGFK